MFSGAVSFNQSAGGLIDVRKVQLFAKSDGSDPMFEGTTALSACNKAAIATAWKAQGVVADSGHKNYDGNEDWSTLQTCGTGTRPRAPLHASPL